jgi:hypothetical protein
LAFSYWTDKPWFLTEGQLLLYSSYLPLGVPNWTVIYINTVPQQARSRLAIRSRKSEISRRTSYSSAVGYY